MIKNIITSSKITIALLFVILISSINSNDIMFKTNAFNPANQNIGKYGSSSLTPHSPISISSDSDFISYGFPGLGTEEQPYIIENYNITTSESSGISITSTTKYFVIRNCQIDATSVGISLDVNVAYSGTIENNTIVDNSMGIYIHNSEPCTFVNNSFENNNDGMYIYNSKHSHIINNTFIKNKYYGIKSESQGWSTIANNTFIEDGLYINENTELDYELYSIYNNTINGKEIFYLRNYNGFVISTPIYGQLLVINCTNITIRNQLFSNVSNSCFVKFSTNISLENNVISNTTYRGIFIEESNHVVLKNNDFNNNKRLSLYISKSNSSNIQENTLINNEYSIYLDSCNFSKVVNNTCSDNLVNIKLSYCSLSLISNNTSERNNNDIILYSSSIIAIEHNTCTGTGFRGIWLDNSENCIVKNNTCHWKTNGLILDLSNSNLVYNNSFLDNHQYGVCLNTGENNSIYFNEFIDNSYGGIPQAYDDGVNNLWYNDSVNVGNYWSDWDELSPYLIDGSAGAYDLYPISLSVPNDPPTITHPDDLIYELDSVGNKITWVAYDTDLSAYYVYLNGSGYDVGPCFSGVPINVYVDHLAVGVYDFTIVVVDSGGNNISDSVIVTVIQVIDEYKLHLSLFLLSPFVALFTLMLYRKRRIFKL